MLEERALLAILDVLLLLVDVYFEVCPMAFLLLTLLRRLILLFLLLKFLLFTEA